MKIEKLLMIPEHNQIEQSILLAQTYHCGFEYNDFYVPTLLEDDKACQEIVQSYMIHNDLPAYRMMHGAFFDINVASDDPQIYMVSDKRVEQSLLIAKQLGASAIVFHTNFIANFHSESYCQSWLERNTVYWKEKLSKYNELNIYIENMFDMSYELLEQLAKNLSVYSNFGICFDYGHAHAFGDPARIDDWISAFAPYVKHIHINDNDFLQDLHLPIGEGKIDWNYFKKIYNTHFSDTSVLVEVRGLEELKRSLQFLSDL